MGMYTEVSLNVVIVFDGFKKNFEIEAQGCPKCKTEHRSGFCHICGTKTGLYTKKITKDIDNWWDIYEIFFCKDDCADEIYSEDHFRTPTEGVIVSNYDGGHNIELSENTYTPIPDSVDVNKLIKDFTESHSELLEVLEKNGMNPKVSFGCVYDYS